MKQVQLTEETSVPLSWIFIACAVILSMGIFTGNLSTSVSANERRITKLEEALDALPRIDRRLARIEGAQGIFAPKEDRIPASNGP